MDNKQLPQEVTNSKPQISNATVKKPTVVQELAKYATNEVIIPQSKDMMRNVLTGVINMFSDAATKSIDKALYPDGAPRRNQRNDVYGQHTNYRVYSTSNSQNKPPRESISTRSSTEVKLIWVDTEAQAKDIVNSLIEDIDNYGKAKVATLYEMIKEPTTFADFKFGWTKDDVRNISYYRDRGKYFIDLPKPVNIENI